MLADYSSQKLDFNSIRTFRDLTKPVGALEPTRLENFRERRKMFEDPGGEVPPFLYGSHYSNVGTVLYYLVRVEPFTSHAMALQSGHFDHADRMFHSVEETWSNCLLNQSDLKELTPEWFYLPEFLENARRLRLGVRQNGVGLDHVALPPWAKGSAAEFVRLHREALECEFVSTNLHSWIDLIFGFKQRGADAIDADNVFFHLTYEGAVDLAAITDPVQRRAVEVQIANFGQVPSQLFTSPHPRRLTRDEAAQARWST